MLLSLCPNVGTDPDGADPDGAMAMGHGAAPQDGIGGGIFSARQRPFYEIFLKALADGGDRT
ncbi:hypothetical protein [Rugamonas rubra]|uniref:hypothetical protein n=1 Tax=Rugamonas rubra TaxID=758825 RepID=UPI001113F5C5|nr:hypothetical protein [Rugamonas rubra]